MSNAEAPQPQRETPLAPGERRGSPWLSVLALLICGSITGGIIFAVNYFRGDPDAEASTATSRPTSTAPSATPTPTELLRTIEYTRNAVPEARNAMDCDMSGATQTIGGEPNSTIGTYPWLVTVVGCTENYAMLYPSPTYYEVLDDEPWESPRLLYAAKTSSGWNIPEQEGIIPQVQPVAEDGTNYPDAMDAQLAAAGLPVELRPELLGEEPIPGTGFSEGKPSDNLTKTVQSLDGTLTVDVPDGWSVITWNGSPGGAVVDQRSNFRFALSSVQDTAGPVSCPSEQRPFLSLVDAPGVGATPTSPDLLASLRVYTSEPFYAGYGVVQLGSPLKGTTCDIPFTATVDGQPVQVGTTPSVSSADPAPNTIAFDDLESAKEFVRSPEFATDLAVLRTVRATGATPTTTPSDSAAPTAESEQGQ